MTESTPVLADDCRRAGNELYRAACILAQKHGDAHGDGVTFGGEGAKSSSNTTRSTVCAEWAWQVWTGPNRL